MIAQMLEEKKPHNDRPVSLRLDSGIAESIANEALARYPHECCGALIGSVNGGVAHLTCAVAIPNVVPGSAADRFLLDPWEHALLEQKMAREKNGLSVVGFFHSHPDGQPRPSQIDLENAAGLFLLARKFYVYAIQQVSGPKATCGELTYWRLTEAMDGFEKLTAE